METCGETRAEGLRFTTKKNGDVTAAPAFNKSAVGCTAELDISFKGEPLFLCTVLDQGFYRNGIYTAPNEKLENVKKRGSETLFCKKGFRFLFVFCIRKNKFTYTSQKP